jgi:N-sulfoglucosamine sulfohydrolase
LAYSQKTKVPPAKAISNNDYAANFEAFLSEADVRSWCFWVGFHEPHREYEFGAGERSCKQKQAIGSVPGYWPDTDTVRTDILDYAYEIE